MEFETCDAADDFRWESGNEQTLWRPMKHTEQGFIEVQVFQEDV